MFSKCVSSFYNQAKIFDPIEGRVLENLSTRSLEKIDHALEVYAAMPKRVEVEIIATLSDSISLDHYRRLIEMEERLCRLCQKYKNLTMKFDPTETSLLVFNEDRLIYSICDNLDLDKEVTDRLDAIEEIVDFYRAEGFECSEWSQDFQYRLQLKKDHTRIDVWLSRFDKIIVDQIENRELVRSSSFKYVASKDHAKHLKLIVK